MRSENINELAVALAKVQGSITHAVKDSMNPHLKNKYADLASVWEACRKQLAENGLSIAQLPDGLEDNCLLLDTTMFHISGQWISSRIKMPMPKQDPQGYGSALTYARRYALAAMVGVYQDDDDADGAVKKPVQQQNKQTNTNIPTQQNKPTAQQASEPELISQPQLQKLQIVAKEQGLTADDMKGIMAWKYHVDSSKKLTKVQGSYMIENIAKLWTDYIAYQSTQIEKAVN